MRWNFALQGKIGGLLMMLMGLTKTMIDYRGEGFERALDGWITVGLGLGVYGILEAIGSSRKER